MSRPRSLACIAACALTIIAGLLLLIAGSIFTKQTTYIRNYWTQIYSLSIFSLCIGGLAIIFAAVLIYVVKKQFPALTTLFCGFLVFVAFASVVCGVLLIVGRSNIVENSYKNTAEIFGNYSVSDLVTNTNNIVAKIQKSYQCCGIEKATYWEDKYPDKESVPDSCCIKASSGCGKGTLTTQDTIYLRGCAEPMYIHIAHKYSILIGFNFLILVLTLVSAILGIIFERYIRQQYQLM